MTSVDMNQGFDEDICLVTYRHHHHAALLSKSSLTRARWERDTFGDLINWHFQAEEQHRLFVFQADSLGHGGAEHGFPIPGRPRRQR